LRQLESGSDSEAPKKKFCEPIVPAKFLDGHFETHAEQFFVTRESSRLSLKRATSSPED
jgi:hypothetical protein